VARERNQDPTEGVSARDLATLVDLVTAGALSRTAAKTVLDEIWTSEETPTEAMERLRLGRVTDPEKLARWARQAVRENPEQASQYRGGKQQVLGFFVGHALALSGGRADPQGMRSALRQALSGGPRRDSDEDPGAAR
jgi:aspartyl-tRNA(Asn)/glutamyl-tRNA(Gln) amidotransferase subunit B